MLTDPLSYSGVLWLSWGALWFVASLKTGRTEQAEPFTSRVQHLVPILIAFWLVFSPATFGPRYEATLLRWVGAAMTAIGLGFAVWARYHLGR